MRRSPRGQQGQGEDPSRPRQNRQVKTNKGNVFKTKRTILWITELHAVPKHTIPIDAQIIGLKRTTNNGNYASTLLAAGSSGSTSIANSLSYTKKSLSRWLSGRYKHNELTKLWHSSPGSRLSRPYMHSKLKKKNISQLSRPAGCPGHTSIANLEKHFTALQAIQA